MAGPALAVEQRAMALPKAAQARTARSELLTNIRAGTVTVAQVSAMAQDDDLVKRTTSRRCCGRCQVVARRGPLR